MVRVHDSADVAADVKLGEGTSVWHLAQIREGAVLGTNCVIGRGAYIGTGVQIGSNCKVQNYALVYEPATLADGVFVGPAVVFTNDRFPRAITPEGDLKTAEDWEPVGVTIGTGASIGARSVCVAPVTVGAWALVAAGSVVTADVADYAVVAGAPAKRIGWVGEVGVPLRRDDSGWVCPTSGRRYLESNEVLTPETDLDQTTTTTTTPDTHNA